MKPTSAEILSMLLTHSTKPHPQQTYPHAAGYRVFVSRSSCSVHYNTKASYKYVMARVAKPVCLQAGNLFNNTANKIEISFKKHVQPHRF